MARLYLQYDIDQLYTRRLSLCVHGSIRVGSAAICVLNMLVNSLHLTYKLRSTVCIVTHG